MLVCCFDAQQKRNRKTKVRHIMELLLLLRGLLCLTNFESQNYVCAYYEYCFDAPVFLHRNDYQLRKRSELLVCANARIVPKVIFEGECVLCFHVVVFLFVLCMLLFFCLA